MIGAAFRNSIAACLTAAIFTAAAASPVFGQPSPLSAADVSQPEGWDADLRMQEAEDINPDPHIIEFALEARIAELEFIPGAATPAWTYNGTVPGPLIRARIGDRLIVHFTNSLPEPTTIHWHGVRLPNDMDGAPGVTQDPVEPGETFRYEFIFEDAGTFWYHPHFNSAVQVSRGLYGAIVVEDPDDPVGIGTEDELVVVLSDISLNEDGSFRPPDQGGAFGDLFGREGDIVLVNGKVLPSLKMRAGKQQRWRVVNAAITRYFPIALRNHRWLRVGGDGGLIAETEELPRMVLTPGERADIILTPVNEPGEHQTFAWLPVDRGWGTATGRTRVPLIEIETVSDPAVTPIDIPRSLRRIAPVDTSSAVEKTVELNIFDGRPRREMMGINGVAHDHLIEARIGETHVWTVVNDTPFDHPFHLHGYFFQVLDESRTPEWKDTVNIPAGARLRLAVQFDERPGMWMVHCHILDHADVGMMGLLSVLEPGQASVHPVSHSHAHH